MTKNRTATAIALFLIIAMATSTIVLPVYAPTGTKKTFAYIGATPNPVGLGEQTLLHIGITSQLDRVVDGWTGLTVTVTKPDGTTQTLGPYRTDSTGGTGDIYIPSDLGTYKLQTHFPAQWYNVSGNNIFYEASDSFVLELVVQEEKEPYWPTMPLPTEYWIRPIDRGLREWSTIAASWLANPVNSIAEGNDYAPETAHVLWNKVLVLGGVVGGSGNLYGVGDFAGDAYEGKFSNSLIIQGILFYQKYDSMGGSDVDNWVVAVDLHTGETLWEKELLDPNGTRLMPSFGQIYFFKSFNTQGAHAYLWCTSGSTWQAFDPLTGRWIFTMTDVPGGTSLYGPNGEIYRYTVNLRNGYMTLWNSSSVIDLYWGTDPTYFPWGSWRPQGKIVNATGPTRTTAVTPLGLNGYNWNKTIPSNLPGSVNAYIFGDIILGYDRGGQTTRDVTWGDPQFTIWAISAKPGSEGQLVYKKSYSLPAGNLSWSTGPVSAPDRVRTFWCKEQRAHYGYDMDTGDSLWGPTPSQNYLDIFGMRTLIAYGNLYSVGMSGIVYCYDVKTGEPKWNYSYRDQKSEVLWANDWSIRPLFFADGKLYLGESEHSVNEPMPRGAPFVCLNATNGDEIWSAEGMFRQTDWGGRGVIGDSIIATMDTYDQMVYAIGKGPTSTTVVAPDSGVPFGTSVMIRGTVMDVSPGTKSSGTALRFPNGVSAVSDANQSAWMQYVYKQWEPDPHETWIGVTVDLYVVDENMNARPIGRATTSAENGAFAFSWTPDIPGKYYLYAEFAGSKAYYGSHGETAFVVDEAVSNVTPIPTQAPTSIADQYFVPAVTGLFAAIAVVGAILALMMRRK